VPIVSTQETFKKGQLVRYLETASRWSFALVKRVRPGDVEIDFFDGSPAASVALSQIEPFDTFLGVRERTFSRTRSQLTKLFYGQAFQRLPVSRLREMQQALRKAGVSFHPEEWPTADTRIQLSRDGSFVERDSVAADFKALLPQWLDPFVLPSGSRDPLGLQAPAEKLVNEVLPGLTVFTSRAGYYGFLTWAIRTVNGMTQDEGPRVVPRREVLNAFERALVLCEFVHHGQHEDHCRLIGQRSKLRVLSSREGDKYRVPKSILKNQNSAGCFRLFATSLVSLGLVEEADELAAEGLLPFRLTALGDDLANVFEKKLDKSFVSFAISERGKSCDELRAWGSSLCFSSIARRAAYRKHLLQGLLLGNTHDTVKRYRTVAHLFAHGLIKPDTGYEVAANNPTEEEAAVLEEEIGGAGISNLEVVLHFYRCAPDADLIALQSLAVFELLSLGLSAIFRAALVSVTESGKADLSRLSHSIASHVELAQLWQTPMENAKPKTVKRLVDDLFKSSFDDSIRAASIGGALLLRVIQDRLLPTVWDHLTQLVPEPSELVDRCLRGQMHLSLEAALPGLLQSLIERHETVSRRKNRQRWVFCDGDVLVRDDPQTMGMGLHALRFPQLGSLMQDLDVTEEDLRHD
jgi:hypothetical protein